MTAITGITVAGADVAECDIDGAAVRITHGREGVADGPSASTAALTILVPVMPAWTVGDPITIDVRGARRFTGHLTDVTLTGHETHPDGLPAAVLSLTAVGAVSLLGVRDVTAQAPWPAESGVARANRILTAADVPHTVAGLPQAQVIGQDVDRRTALSLIGDLATAVGAAVFDTTDGRVSFQMFTDRAPGVQWVTWAEAAGTWDAAAGTWADWAVDSPNADLPVNLPCDSVAWEPVWTATAGLIVNHVTIGYGENDETLTRSDPASVARYGRRHAGEDTQLADAQSADYRAGLILARYALPAWNMRSVDVDPGALDPATLADVMAVMCGNRVQLTGLPQPAPAASVVMVAEGWTHTLSAYSETLTFALSDPSHSYAGIVWEAVDPAITWNTVPPALSWPNAITNAALMNPAP